jgi:predicted dehydrogenase
VAEGARVRIGVVGTSYFVGRVHLPLLQSHPQAELVAVCGRTAARRDSLAIAHQIPQQFACYSEMLSQAKLDAIVIATPDDLHAPMTLAAIDAGLHVLCEKPLALNSADAAAMLARARAASVKHMVFFRWRWLAAYERLQRLLAEGWVGRPLQWVFSYLSSGGWKPGYAWRFDEQRAIGTLGDLGSHLIDMALWLGGPVVTVSASLNTFHVRHRPDGSRMLANDSAMLLLRFADGSQGTIHASSVSQLGSESQMQMVAVYGDEGWLSAEFQRSRDPQLRGARRGEEIRPVDSGDPAAEGVGSYEERLLASWKRRSVADRLFVDAILSDQQVAPSFEDGVAVQRVIDAALESHQTDSWVDVHTADHRG